MRKALQDSPAKEKIMDAAQTLVLSKGFVGTSVDDICHKAKLTKGSFFHYFKSKDELGEELLKRYCANKKQEFIGGCCSTEKDPLKRVYGIIDFFINMSKNNSQGCLLGSMAQELSETHPDIRSICCESFSGFAEMLAKDFKEAKEKYVPKAAFDPESLAYYFVSVLQGSILLSKVGHDARIKENNAKHFKEYVKSLFKT